MGVYLGPKALHQGCICAYVTPSSVPWPRSGPSTSFAGGWTRSGLQWERTVPCIAHPLTRSSTHALRGYMHARICMIPLHVHAVHQALGHICWRMDALGGCSGGRWCQALPTRSPPAPTHALDDYVHAHIVDALAHIPEREMRCINP